MNKAPSFEIARDCEIRFQAGTGNKTQILKENGIFLRNADGRDQGIRIANDDEKVLCRIKNTKSGKYEWMIVNAKRHPVTDDSRRIERAFKLAPELKELVKGLVFNGMSHRDHVQIALDRGNAIVKIVGRDTFGM